MIASLSSEYQEEDVCMIEVTNDEESILFFLYKVRMLIIVLVVHSSMSMVCGLGELHTVLHPTTDSPNSLSKSK